MKKLSKEFWYMTIVIIIFSIFSVLGDLIVLNITNDYFKNPSEIIIRVVEGE